jgi:two-component system nitrogen regulation sensor histidine kinase NtrY
MRLWVVGGTLLDTPLAEHLARLAGAQVEILSSDAVVATGGAAEMPVSERWVELPPAARVKVSISQAAFRSAESGIVRAFALLMALGVSCAILLGLFVSNWITRPVEALTAAARKVAQGQLDAQVEATASGEVGDLVATFNRMTSELRETTERLVTSERIAAWQEVARRLAHEIKNPLTPIKMSLETLVDAQKSANPRFPGLFQESAGAVLEEVDRLKRIVDEFSRFARLPKPQLGPLDLGELAGQVLALFSSPRPGVRIQSELQRTLPIDGDRDQLTQVLVNLVKNAEEAMPGGGQLAVRTYARDGHAVLDVADSGPGIKPEDRKRIFEPYFTTKAGGTGLGLAIAARIAQEHGGQLEAGVAPGGGALFSLSLPLRS